MKKPNSNPSLFPSLFLFPFLFLFLFAFLFPFLLYGQDVKYPYPKGIIPNEVSVIKIQDGVMTLKANEGFEIWQYNLAQGNLISYFAAEEPLSKSLYELKFKDNYSTYKQALEAYRVNDIREPLCTFYTCFIDSSNEVYVLVKGIEAQPINGSSSNFNLIPFYAVLHLGNNKVKEYFLIDPQCSETEFSFRPDADFFRKGNDFVFGISKEEVSTANFFLGKWSPAMGQLRFNKILPYELPPRHVNSPIGYGFMRYIYKGDKLMFYSCPSYYDFDKKMSIDFQVKDMPESNFKDAQKGAMFQINFSVCDYRFNRNEIWIVLRKYNKFYLSKYSISTMELVNEIPIEGVWVENLFRFPFFSSDGRLVILKKEGSIVLRNLK